MEGGARDRFRRMLVGSIRQFSDPYYQGFAAQIAFFLLLSLVPTIIVISQLLGVFDIPISLFDKWMEENINVEIAGTIRELLTSRSTVGNNIFLIAVAFWAASRGQFALMRIANYTYSGGRSTGNYWTERIRSFRSMFVTVLMYAAVVFLLVYGNTLFYLAAGRFVKQTILVKIWSIFRWPVTVLLYFLLVLFIYYLLPQEKWRFRDILPGAIASSAGMLLVTVVYSSYVTYVSTYNIIYGSLASIAVLLFWFYFLAWVLVLGILFNKVWKDTAN